MVDDSRQKIANRLAGRVQIITNAVVAELPGLDRPKRNRIRVDNPSRPFEELQSELAWHARIRSRQSLLAQPIARKQGDEGSLPFY